MKRMSQALFGGVVCAVVCAVPAFGMDVGGYAVANHRPCGVSNLPATTREMEKFFADENFPEMFERNFYWTDASVTQMGWDADSDYTEHGDTANGMNGVDASSISYIASHGVTSGDVYKASMGSSGSGGCQARSSDMLLGDQNARYLILSTCQGVKIGSGENPNTSGANPSRTWNASRVNGLNCIFGYSNNMADADGYGALFLDYMKNTDEPVADSFMRSGRAVASYNIPAVICFGATEEEASARITGDMTLSTESAAGGASAYSYELSRSIALEQFTMGHTRVNRVEAVPMALDTSKFKAGLLSFNKNAGSVSYRKTAAYSTTEMTLSDEQTVEIAERYVRENLVSTEVALTPVRIIDRGFARGLATPQIIGKTVVFAQEMFGLNPLSTSGTVEVYVDGQGEVAGFHFALREFSGKMQDAKAPVTTADLRQNIQSVLSLYRQKFPEADKIEYFKDAVGYDLGADAEHKAAGDLVHQVVVEVTQGEYARRYAESVLLR